MIRTFVAIDLESGIRQRVARAIEKLRPIAPMVKWVEPTTLHLTLKFLGDVSDRDLYSVCKRAANLAAEHRPFQLVCRELGAFPKPQRPRVIWIGVEEVTGELVSLQHQLEKAMGELGFVQELRPYQPHITIGRIPQRGYRPVDFEALQSALKPSDLEFGTSNADEVVVYRSDLGPRGPEYTVMARNTLAAE